MSKRRPEVAIVGRANVGKSTLVNRLIGRREAIEHPQPGVTRDRRGYEVEWNGLAFRIVDTGGWEPRAEGLNAKVRAQAQRAIELADLIVMVVDAETGITDDDLAVAKGLRRSAVPVMLVANKSDDAERETQIHGLVRLGLGEPIPVSALHGRRSGDLLDRIVARLKTIEISDEEPDDSIPVAIVGRPNVGKSSLFNRLVGEDRSVVHDMPGTTRDTVDTIIEHAGVRYRFIDTAGWRRHPDRRGPEYFALARLYSAIDRAAVVLHVIDADEGTTDQDQRIAAKINENGRACILVLNKWDLIEGDEADGPERHVRDQLRFVPWASLVRTSALSGRGIAKLAPKILEAHDAWQRRIPTNELNAWLRDALEGVPLGNTVKGRPIRIRYATQSGAEPPTFVFFGNGKVSASGERALENRLRRKFDLEGTPIRIVVRKRPPREAEV
ncbi:MAG: ribosome biogenesis GTPase Der [Actinomycetota bacterium]